MTMTQTPGLPGIPDALRSVAPVVIPGPDTAILPRVKDGLCKAALTDPQGRVLYWGWLPPNTRIVMRGQRIFMHYSGQEWRQVPVVELGEDGRPV